jgi:cysteine synthase
VKIGPNNDATRDVWIKDESINFTGTHKDRWAYETIIRYRDEEINEALKRNYALPDEGIVQVRCPSMISSGSAALALQCQLRLRNLPNLRVLMDRTRTHQDVINHLETVGAIVVLDNLDEKELTSEDVLIKTHNVGGVDYTTRKLGDPFKYRFYDWLGYEIFNERPKHVFVPVGTGELFANILFLIKDEVEFTRNDPRLVHGIESITDVNLYGAKPLQEKTKRMLKLHAQFHPLRDEIEHEIKGVKANKILGSASGIFPVDETYIQEALAIAKKHNINTEESGVAGLALFLGMRRRIPRDEKVLVVNTGWLPY